MSYTTFDLSHFEVKQDHVVADDTIQKTNEKFEGDADLYDFLVSTPNCKSELRSVCRIRERDQYR
jgi:hypothetical protein